MDWRWILFLGSIIIVPAITIVVGFAININWLIALGVLTEIAAVVFVKGILKSMDTDI